MPGTDVKLLASGFLLALFSSVGQTFFIALFGGQIRAEFGLTHGTFGSLYSLATLVSGFAMLWMGAALDRISLQAYSVTASAMLALSCVLLASTQSATLLVMAIFGLRLAGQGMMSHASVTGMARAFTRHRGKAIAFATMGHPVGEALLPSIVVTAVALLGWREVWIAAAVLITVAIAVVFCLLRQAGLQTATEQPGDNSGSESYTRGEVIRSLRFYLIVPTLVGASFTMTGLLFHQVHLTEVKGWTLAWFASCFTAYAVASTVSLIAFGSLIDRLTAVRLMPFYLLPLCLACLLLAFGSHQLVALAFMGLAGVTMGAGKPVLTAMWAEVYGVGHLGAVRALAASLIVIASALAPATMGWLIDLDVSMESIALSCAAYLICANLLLVTAFHAPAFRR